MKSSHEGGQSEIAVVALDMNVFGDNFKSFQALSAKEKVDKIEKRIEAICEDLLKKEPNAMWIIAWREFSVSEGEQFKGLPREVRKLFKEKMQALTSKYEQLTIVGGTISTKIHFNTEERLANIIQYYEDNAWVGEAELRSKDEYKTFMLEIDKLKKAVVQEKREWDVIRNTSYVFNGKDIKRHDKITPINEGESDYPFLFQPGNKKNNSPYLTILHPKTGLPITIGVEICREHVYGTLKKYTEATPLFQFVMSASIGLKRANMHGHYVLQLDSRYAPRLLKVDTEGKDLPQVTFYQSNIEEEYRLAGPLDQDGLFVDKVNEKLQQAMSDFPDKKVLLEEIQKEFNQAVCNHDENYEGVSVVYKALRNRFKDLESSHPPTLFSPKSLDQLMIDLNELIIQHYEKNKGEMEYRTSLRALDKGDKFDYFLKNEIYDQALSFMDKTVLATRQLSLPQAELLLGAIMMSDQSEEEKYISSTLLFDNIKTMIMNSLPERDNETLLNGLCASDSLEMVEIIMPYCKEHLNTLSANGNSPLHMAIKHHASIELIEYLIEEGANIHLPDSQGKTPMMLAKENDDSDMIDLLAKSVVTTMLRQG